MKIEQAIGQADPTKGSITFDIVFDVPVTGLDPADFTVGGTYTGTFNANLTGSETTYQLTLSNMSGEGTVIVSLDADKAVDGSLIGNAESTSLDNTVEFDSVAPRRSLPRPRSSEPHERWSD